MNKQDNHYILYAYCIGVIAAFILGCIDAYRRSKRGENIEQFPEMIAPIALMSWLYVFMFFRDLFRNKKLSDI